MSFLFGSSGDSTTTVQQQLPDWLNTAGKNAASIAGSIASQPYTAYGGPRVASESPNEKAASTAAGAEVGKYTGAYSTAQGLTGAGAAPITDKFTSTPITDQFKNESQDYMNPYLQGVLQPQIREINKQQQQQTLADNAASIGRGAFGGSRNAVLQGQRELGATQTVGDVTGKAYADAYDKALAGFQTDVGIKQGNADRSLQAFQANTAVQQGNAERSLAAGAQTGTLAGQQATVQGTAIDRQAAFGGLERGLTQSSLDTAYQDFTNQRDWQKNQLDAYIRTLSGVPYPTSSSTTTPGASVAAQATGAAVAGAGLYQLFFGGK